MTDKKENSLPFLAKGKQWKDLEEVWLERVEDPGSHEPFLEAARHMMEEGKDDEAACLLVLLAESLERKKRFRDVLDVLGPLIDVQRGGEPGVRKLFLNSIREIWGQEHWLPLFLDHSGLSKGKDLREAKKRFFYLMHFIPGRAVYHRNGWEEGVVEGIEKRMGRIQVRFADGRLREIPLASAEEVLEPLLADDLRAMRLLDMEGLRLLAREKPAELLRKVIRLRRGKATAGEIKEVIHNSVIPSEEWPNWWKEARERAIQDPYLAVEGTGIRMLFSIRESPLSLDEEALEAVSSAPTLREAVQKARTFLRQQPKEPQKILDVVERRASEDSPSKGELIEALLMLEEEGRVGEIKVEEIFQQVLKGTPRDLEALFSSLPGSEACRALLSAFSKMEPSLWVSSLAGILPSLPVPFMELAVPVLLKAGGASILHRRFREFFETPSRFPDAAFVLAKAWRSGAFQGVEGGPSDSEIFKGLLSLCRALCGKGRDRKEFRKLLKKVSSFLLSGTPPVLADLAWRVSKEDLLQGLHIARSSWDFPDEIGRVIRRGILKRFPEVEFEEGGAFWEGDFILTTRAGLEKRRDALRVLLEEKIPENSRAIGEAAAHGDLSENAEWEAAIEEQKRLTEMAAAIEGELKKVRLIEDVHIPEGLAAPGCRITFAEKGKSEERTITILGPWDADGRDVINYKAPLAQGFLKRRRGETFSVFLPHGEFEVTILKVERLF